jgi:UDP-N-acetylglucosamine--N-acetylmuramyl-(pentapeptide) pyrophosphoryl-undecaprenol N-acetylglucosamine transferase
MDEKFRVVFAGGGSGGHIYPLLAVADEIERKSVELKFNCELIYLGTRDAFSPLIEGRGIRISPIAAGKLRRYFSLENITDIPKFFIGFIQALFKLYAIMPDVIFSKGGTGALPVVIAGWFYRIPVAIHESDAIPGLTNTMSAHFARKVFLSFDEAAKKFDEKKVEIVGSPIRRELLENRTTQELAKESLGFNASHQLMLVLGGSQGSIRINNFILANLQPILKETQLLHQTGVANFLEAQKLSHAALIDQAADANRYVPINYFTDNYATALTAADIVVVRAGSGTIFEVAAFGKPAILIPLAESANGHQRANAYAFADTGAGVVIEEANLLPGIFLQQLKSILTNEELRKKMSEASAKFFTPDSAEQIADEILEMGA